jgi:2',3'-cyclic-nucleotide 2'-phosphodiesterase (5'-nucleotidase family)
MLALLLVAPALAEQPLAGVVADAQGHGVAQVTLTVFEAKPAGRPREPLVTTSSDDSGRFSVTVPPDKPLWIELQGSLGRGRVRVSADRDGQPIELSYPVRTSVVLLHDNDMHFNFNHREAFAAKVAEVRCQYENVYLFNAGDIFIRDPARWNDPRPEYYAAQSVAIIDAMNDLKYDAMTLGNHEFDYIDEWTIAALRRARFPLLAANVQVTTERLPQPKPYHLFETANGLTIAVLGLSMAYAREGVRSLDPVATAREYLHLRKQHPVLVGLTHLGFRTDNRLAETLGAFDVILGGHSHTLVDPAVHVNGVLIAQAAGTASDTPVHPDRPKYLGQVVLVLENERVVEKRGQVFTFSAAAPTE